MKIVYRDTLSHPCNDNWCATCQSFKCDNWLHNRYGCMTCRFGLDAAGRMLAFIHKWSKRRAVEYGWSAKDEHWRNGEE